MICDTKETALSQKCPERAIPIILGGAYPTLAPEHAARHSGADTVVAGSIAEARGEAPALELYGPDRLPRFAGVYLYHSQDVTLTPHAPAYEASYEEYRLCVAALHQQAGLRPRTDQLGAMLLVGTPCESVEAIAERAIHLASIVGSVNLVPWQYCPGTATGRLFASLAGQDHACFDLTALNCKLYPLARRSGIPYHHYVELTRLAALLNTKFHSTTFDFLGDGLVARAVQQSLVSGGWRPHASHPPTRQECDVEAQSTHLLDWPCHQAVQNEQL